ncbi:MAG: hypothetical protein ACYDAL_06020 [Candidatus Dormibacteraceae bacterium]
MGNTLTAQYLIAALVAMVVVVTFRRKTSKVFELAVWIALVWVCVLAITNNTNPQARALTDATVWAAGQMASMTLALSLQGALRWMDANRFTIAEGAVLLFALDLFGLALVSTKRQAKAWIPVTRLGEWMVLPRLRATQPEPAVVYAADEINRRLGAWGAATVAATMTQSTIFFVWLRDVEIPSAGRGLTNLAVATGGAWRRVAAGRPQLGEVRISRLVPAPTRPGPRAGRSRRRVAARSAPPGPDIVDINLLAERVEARKLQAGTAPRKPRRRTAPIAPQPDAKTDKIGATKRHRHGRLAS